MRGYIKAVLGIKDDSKDILLDYYIESVSNDVKNYCNLNDIPESLEMFIKKKVISIFKYELSEYKGVKSISEGDTRLEFAIEGNGEESKIYSLNDNDRKELRNFRKVKF